MSNVVPIRASMPWPAVPRNDFDEIRQHDLYIAQSLGLRTAQLAHREAQMRDLCLSITEGADVTDRARTLLAQIERRGS